MILNGAPHPLAPGNGALRPICAYFDSRPALDLDQLVDAAEGAAYLAGPRHHARAHTPLIDAPALTADRLDDVLVQLVGCQHGDLGEARLVQHASRLPAEMRQVSGVEPHPPKRVAARSQLLRHDDVVRDAASQRVI